MKSVNCEVLKRFHTYERKKPKISSADVDAAHACSRGFANLSTPLYFVLLLHQHCF